MSFGLKTYLTDGTEIFGPEYRAFHLLDYILMSSSGSKTYQLAPGRKIRAFFSLDTNGWSNGNYYTVSVSGSTVTWSKNNSEVNEAMLFVFSEDAG